VCARSVMLVVSSRWCRSAPSESGSSGLGFTV
jgi:hypothetical protein